MLFFFPFVVDYKKEVKNPHLIYVIEFLCVCVCVASSLFESAMCSSGVLISSFEVSSSVSTSKVKVSFSLWEEAVICCQAINVAAVVMYYLNSFPLCCRPVKTKHLQNVQHFVS